MFLVTREIDFCYGHRLLNYAGKCRHLHGHNGRAAITIEAERVDDRGMVLDFSDIKRVVAGWIDRELDHRMILHRDDPVAPLLQGVGEPLFLMEVNPTAENIAKLIFDFAASQGFPIIEARLWETPQCVAAYGRGDGSPTDRPHPQLPDFADSSSQVIRNAGPIQSMLRESGGRDARGPVSG